MDYAKEMFLNNSFNNQTKESPNKSELNHLFFLATNVLDIFCIFLIYKTKKNLNKVESYILIFLSLALVIIKFRFNFYFYLMNKTLENNGPIICICFFAMISMDIEYYLILFYYSLYHLSFLNRSTFFKNLNAFINKSFIFYGYLLSSYFIFIIIFIWYAIFYQNTLFKNDFKKYDCLKFYKSSTNFFPMILLASFSFLSIFIYSASQIYLIFRIFRYNKSKNQRDRKNFKIILKFFLYSALSSIVFISSLLSFFDFLDKKKKYFIMQLIIYFIYAIINFQSVLFIVIHDKLKKTLITILKNLF